MKKHHDQLWEITLPDDWEVEADEDSVSLYHPDGPGTIQISATRQEEGIRDEDLREMAADHLEAGAELEEVELGDFDGFVLRYDTEGEYWCEWYLKAEDRLLFVTYACALEEEGEEEDLVEAVLDTLALHD
ncbi:MAG: hypothetical protein OQK27_05665 [Gammaproteobacteria bacterium]|nr:hypothetical protein [Gammaproteobacteria bacterium]MCW9057847.1 hypothetical protein [Gammaproteobacteria bacterium]HSJ48627.1 hypothetical protein [Gammaproteobacteria bacterium]